MNWQPGITLYEIEREVVIAALRFYHWNRTQTAQALDVSIRTIQNKIVRYIEEGILREEEVGPFKPLEKEEPLPEPEPEPEPEPAPPPPKRELILRKRREYGNA